MRLLFLFLVLSFSLFAQSPEHPIDSFVKTKQKIYTTSSLKDKQSILIDGLLNDEAWDSVPWASSFIEFMPDEGSSPGQETAFKILYDANYLYAAFRCFDTDPSKIEKRLSRRDGFEGDWVELALGSYGDMRTAFSFTGTVAGVKGDEFITNNGKNWDRNWNPIWYYKAKVDEKGWSAEFKIPLSQLRFGKESEQVWGLQVKRYLFRNDERSLWQRIPLDAGGYVSEFGLLKGLSYLQSQRQLEIQPYSVIQFDSYEQEVGNPFQPGNDFKLNGGLDAKIGVTNDLTLDLTINPDFGQVEADPAALALDGFQVFFQEQRPFFVENKNIFEYGLGTGNDNLFYSRRIGRSPQADATTEDGEFVNQPQNTKILGAAKFSGKTKKGLSIGVLETVTSREYAAIYNTEKGEREEVVEPLTNYFVGRVQQDFNAGNSFIGGIVTATHRKLEPNLSFLHKQAYGWGLDFRHSWKERTYFLEGNVIGSHIAGSAASIEETQSDIGHLFQRTDASHLSLDSNRTSLTGTGGRLAFGKSGSGNWEYSIGADWKSPELELNAIGFLRQADAIGQTSQISYKLLKSTPRLRRFSSRLEQVSKYDFQGNFNRLRFENNTDINFKNNSWMNIGFGYQPISYDTRALRGGPRFRNSQEVFSYLFAGTDGRKKLKVFGGIVLGGAAQKQYSFSVVRGGMSYQPTNAFQISLEPEYKINTSQAQYVSTVSFNGIDRYILGNLKQHTLSASLRFNYSINPNMTIQYYGQPFISKGRYASLNRVKNSMAANLNDRFMTFKSDEISYDPVTEMYSIDENTDAIMDYEVEDPDFLFVQYRSNLVFRWEYLPGSEVFLVWSHGTSDSGDPDNRLWTGLENQILNQKLAHTFLVKATYRFIL